MNIYLIAILAGLIIVSQVEQSNKENLSTNYYTSSSISDINEVPTTYGGSVLGRSAMVVDKHYDSVLGRHDFSLEADH